MTRNCIFFVKLTSLFMVIFILFIVVGALVLTSTLVMCIWFKSNSILNFYLVFTSIVLCFYLICHGLLNIVKDFNLVNFRNLNYINIILFLTPSSYLFVDKLTKEDKYPSLYDINYFIIPIILVYFLNNGFLNETIYGNFFLYLFLLFYTTFYLYRTYKILYGFSFFHYVSEPFVFKTIIVQNWAKFIFSLMVSVIVHFFVIKFFHFWLEFNYDLNLFLESLLLVVFLVGYFKVLFTPELLYGTMNLKLINDNNELSNSFLKDIWSIDLLKDVTSKDVIIYSKINLKLIDYIKEIDEIATVDFRFRNHDYSVNNLAFDTGMPKYFIDYIFKYHCKVSFNEYKKLVRIYDAVNLIDQGYLKSNKLDGLSKHVGFASYNPFLTKFKEVIGVSPFDYNNSKKFR